MRSLSPLESAQLLQHCRDVIIKAIQTSSKTFFNKLTLLKGEIHNWRINNSIWARTLAFKYSQNGHIYVALLFQTFPELVCSWIEAVQDCYILHSPFFASLFTFFLSVGTLDLLNRGDDKLGIQVDGSVEPNSTVNKSFERRGRVNNHCMAGSRAMFPTEVTQIVKIALVVAPTVKITPIIFHETAPNHTRQTVENAFKYEAFYNWI